jgi:hypothetical protein
MPGIFDALIAFTASATVGPGSSTLKLFIIIVFVGVRTGLVTVPVTVPYILPRLINLVTLPKECILINTAQRN